MIWGIALFSIFLSVFWLSIHFNKKSQKGKIPNIWPKVSIIVPAYNEGKNIALCLDSLLKLDYPKDKLEIIVVDDGSKDNTHKIAKKYQVHFPKVVKVFHQENKGKAAALNFGIEKANGIFVACMDADSITTPYVLKMLIPAFVDDKTGAVTAGMKVYKPKTLMQRMQTIEYIMAIWLRKNVSYPGTCYNFLPQFLFDR